MKLNWILKAVSLVFIPQTLLMAQERPSIVFNQEGFDPSATKLAFVVRPVQSAVFYLLGAEKRDTVFRGQLGPSRHSAYSSTEVRKANFTSFRRKGRYLIYVPGLGNSFSFPI